MAKLLMTQNDSTWHPDLDPNSRTWNSSENTTPGCVMNNFGWETRNIGAVLEDTALSVEMPSDKGNLSKLNSVFRFRTFFWRLPVVSTTWLRKFAETSSCINVQFACSSLTSWSTMTSLSRSPDLATDTMMEVCSAKVTSLGFFLWLSNFFRSNSHEKLKASHFLMNPSPNGRKFWMKIRQFWMKLVLHQLFLRT